MGQGGLADTKHRGDVDIEGLDPFFILDFFEGFVCHLEGSIVHQHIDATELFDGLVDQRLAVGLLRDVTGQQQALATGFLDPACGFTGIFMFVQVGDRHIGAFAGKCDGHSAANTAVGTGNQGDFIRQPA
jgi:hypothetical protein